MNKHFPFVLLLIVLFATLDIFAQNIPLPRDVSAAYGKGTRSRDGKPGDKYWQNKSEYRIEAKLLVPEKTLQGKALIKYYNNSPDSLSEIVLRLYQDFFAKGSQRNFSVSPLDITDGVKLIGLALNGEKISLENKSRYSRYDTHLTLYPEQAVKPGGTAEIEIEWSFLIPSVSQVRMGSYDSTTFFLGQWYPQIAVYDDVFGWDKLAYTGETEFYNDFNDYEVSIDVPSDFGVWATGEQQNADDVLPGELISKLETALISDTVVNIIDTTMLKNGFSFKGSAGRTTWIFKAQYVPDFAFGTAKNYLWDATSLKLTGRKFDRLLISAAYNPKSKDFYEVAYFSRFAIDKFSHSFPGVAFPYPYITVFNGGGGMEYPMLVNNGSNSTRAGAAGLAAHEIAHTYFPFYMGINEKRFAWMDEGWAVLFPFESQLELFPESDPRIRNSKLFATVAGTEFDVPLNISTYHARGAAYRNAAYNRPASAYYYLRDFLGREKFDAALHEFISRWNGKHPLPSDFFFTFENILGENLWWYWQPWFFSNAYPDLALENVRVSDSKVKFDVINTGKLPLPVSVKIYDKENKSESFYFTADIWKGNTERTQIEVPATLKVESVMIGEAYIPDINLNNNFYQIK